jgi:diaminopimelate epimerase
MIINMKFTKMQGCGNDYVYVYTGAGKAVHTDVSTDTGADAAVHTGRSQGTDVDTDGPAGQICGQRKSRLAIALSDRHFGIGADGLIFIHPSTEADFEMEMYNADGSRSEMCGNGIRCVGKYVYDKGLTNRTDLRVVSAGQIKYLRLEVENGKVERVRVNMGRPVLEPARIPVLADCDPVVNEPIDAWGREWKMTCVSMGNPHAVLFVKDVAAVAFGQGVGHAFENHPRFPKRTNTEFVQILDRKTIRMRVWERGAGETLACGTGSCAAVVASVLNGFTDRAVTVKLLGGELGIEWEEESGLVYMTGPAATVFEGEVAV